MCVKILQDKVSGTVQGERIQATFPIFQLM